MKRFSSEKFPKAWEKILTRFFTTCEGKNVLEKVQTSLKVGAKVFPPDPFHALRLVRPEDVRVVILGQDPYHEEGQATGLAFSVPDSLPKFPPSLKNIFKEVAREYAVSPRTQGDLSDWACQGVFLLNAVLTVHEGRANSHAKAGWEALTDQLLLEALKSDRPKVFMLWGAFAQKKEELIRKNAAGKILILKSNHPSPLSALRAPSPFIGNNHFKKANEFLISFNEHPIRW